MGDVEKLRELYKRIKAVSHEDPTKELGKEWYTMVSWYPYHLIEMAWNQIRVETQYFFELKIWHDKLDVLYKDHLKRKEQKEEREKPRPEDYKDYRTVWKAHLNKWLDGEITFYQYMTIGVKIGLITLPEYNQEIKRRIKLNKNGFEYFKNPLSIIERR